METIPKSVLRDSSRGRGRTTGLGRGAGIDADSKTAGPGRPVRDQSAETSHGLERGGKMELRDRQEVSQNANTHGRGRTGHGNQVQNRRRSRSMPSSKKAARNSEHKQPYLPDGRKSSFSNPHATSVSMMSSNHLPSTQSGISNPTQSLKPASTDQPELNERNFHLPQRNMDRLSHPPYTSMSSDALGWKTQIY